MKTPITIAQSSQVGGRDHNEDAGASVFLDDGVLLVVADGLGGHEGGELASSHFVAALTDLAGELEQALHESPAATCRRLIEEAGLRMRDQLAETDPALTAHTTCVLAWVTDRAVTVAHAGDSRLYRLGQGELRWRTRDHSIVQLLIDQGELDEAERTRHPDQARLYKSVSGSKPANPSVKELAPLEPGEAVLLCSDGFWGQVEEAEMAGLVGAADLQGSLEALTTTAVNRAGAHSDNATALVAVAR